MTRPAHSEARLLVVYDALSKRPTPSNKTNYRFLSQQERVHQVSSKDDQKKCEEARNACLRGIPTFSAPEQQSNSKGVRYHDQMVLQVELPKTSVCLVYDFARVGFSIPSSRTLRDYTIVQSQPRWTIC